MMQFARIVAVMKKEVNQLRRDRVTFAMIIGVPVMQILLFGYAINTDVRDIKTAIVDQADSHLSRDFVARVSQTQVVDIREHVDTPQELTELIRAGRISLGLYLPADFDRRVIDGSRPAAQLLVDGVDPTIIGIANQLRALPVAFDGNQQTGKKAPTIEVRPYFNPERRSAVFIIPGLIAIILTLTMMMFTAVAIVRERERGNLELLINTPVSTMELMTGKVLPYILIGLVQLALILAVGNWLFAVPVRGSIVQLYAAASVFIAANLSLGLFVSTVAKTQFQAIQMTIFLLLPSILLSGFMFPFDGMPRVVQWIGEVLPATHFIRLTRGIMLREANLADLLPDVLALLAFTLIAMSAAVKRFSKRLD